MPFGASRKDGGINFALFSEHATGVTLCLFLPNSETPFTEIPLDPKINRTGWVWHILLKDLPSEELEYGYRVSGSNKDPENAFDPEKIVIDPYARGLSLGKEWGSKRVRAEKYPPRGRVILDAPFDWEDTKPPGLVPEKLVIYEMHVRGFTCDPSSGSKAPGTFQGIVEKIPYLKSLGINAIELMPIFEFDECENKHVNPKTDEQLKNMWGYSTINFFTPMNRYSQSSSWSGAMNEFRNMVKQMHKNGIEVYLDVVYNHTAEGNKEGPFLSFKGVDNRVYYMIDPQGNYLDFSGTGNTINANHPVVTQFILDSLRYWVSEMRVDGFRFDLASCLTRDPKGAPLQHPPVIEAMSNDPILADVKLIAEAWDAGGLYQVGNFPEKGRWCEWNGRYRDVVRKFIKGTDDQSGEFAQVLSGSQELYGNGSRPYHSINFVTAHDGYTLYDLVSYQEKHNVENGENNQDGSNQNDSWNCGSEGPTEDPQIHELRERQMRNLHTALMVAIGTPMILMGDEYCHTKNGNNNTYCQDNALNYFLWNKLEERKDFARFHRLMIKFRFENPPLLREEFLTDKDIIWHGHLPEKVNWSGDNRFVAYTLNDEVNGQPLYIAFNAQATPAEIHLPPPPEGKMWYRIVDTSLKSPEDFCEEPKALPPLGDRYMLTDHASLIAKAL